MKHYIVKVWQDAEWHPVVFKFETAIDATQFACSLIVASQNGNSITVQITVAEETKEVNE